MISSRESTWPACSCAAAWVLAWMVWLCSSCAPPDRRAARSAWSALAYAAAPPGAVARTSIWLGPVPKLASSTGASWLTWAASAGEVTTTLAPGAAAAAASGTRRPEATPSAASAAHMRVSHAMLWSLLSCPATHAAARLLAAGAALAAVPARAGSRCGLPGAAVRAELAVSWLAPPAAAAATTSPRATNSASRGRRAGGTRRAVHSRMVVTSTRPHEGARDGVAEDGAAGVADLTATLVRLEPATCIGNRAPVPYAQLSEIAEHTPGPISTGMPYCIPY